MSAADLRDALRCGRPRCACRRGRTVHCPAHPDRTPSFVVDEIGGRLLVHCHGGCDQRAVIAALHARQLWPAPGPARERACSASPLDEARRAIRMEARRQVSRLPLEGYRWADEIRWCYRLVRRAHEVATRLGPMSEAAWELLTQAAWLETATHAAEADAA